MDELLQLITDLSIPNITNKEWDILNEIFDFLPIKSLSEFAKEWDKLTNELKSPPITSVNRIEIIVYIEKWIKMANALIKMNRNIAYNWFEITQKQIDADALLDVTLKLLPSNLSLLTLSLEKIDKLSLLERKNQIGFALTTLYSAVSAKISQIELNQFLLEPGSYADKIELTCSMIKKKTHIQSLLILCEKYQDYLESMVKKNIKENDELTYNYYYVNRSIPKHSVIADILTGIDFDCKNLPCKEAIFPFLKKYLLLQDFLFSLKRERYTLDQILLEFTEKFSNFENFIANDEGFFSKPINTVVNFFNSFSTTPEEMFFQDVKKIVEEIKPSLQSVDFNTASLKQNSRSD